jgi:ABC-type bacteriocin/lantibiotic exporter with double-glycine peptidase domain
MRLASASPARALAVLLAAGCCTVAASPLAVPFYAQQKNGCGAASVAMVMHYWQNWQPGPPVVYPSPEEVYQRLYRPGQKGILLADMKRYLEDAKFRVFTLRGEWGDVQEQLTKGRPLIVGLRKGRRAAMHFVVVTGAGEEFVWLNDPTRKAPSRLPRLEFEKRWTFADRWTLLAVPSPDEKPSP